MMELYKYRSQYVYLFFITILAYLGTYFIVPIVSVQGLFSSYLWIGAILYINTLLLHWILCRQRLDKKAVFVLCVLYIVSPLHMDFFEFTPLIQLCIAESALMLALILYLKEKLNYSLVSLMAASFLNFKLLGFFPLVLSSQKIAFRQKVIYGLNALIIIIYSLPEFVKEFSYGLDNLKTAIYSFESLIVPLNFSFLNNSVLMIDYYPVWFLAVLIIIAIVTAIYGQLKKFSYGQAFSFTIAGLLISLIVPVKLYFKPALSHYLYIPSAYPYIMILFFLLLTLLLKKYTSKVIIGLLGMMSIVWILATMSIQASTREIVASWDTAIGKLPEKYNYMEDVQYDYVQILMKHGFAKEAEAIVASAKLNYLHEKWFILHISLASQRRDEDLVRKIYDEMGELKIPLPEDVDTLNQN